MATAINAKYMRKRRYARLRHGRRLVAWLAGQVTDIAASATGQTIAAVRTTNTKAEATVVFAGQPGNTDTLTIGNITYTFLTALTNLVPYEVLRGVSAATARDNLVAAITAGAGVGTTYSTGTTAHPLVTAAAATNDILITALLAANVTPGFTVPLSKSAANLTLPTLAQLDGPKWTATAHGFSDAEGPYVITAATTLPTGYTAGTPVWVHVVGTNEVAFATSQEAIERGDFLQTTSAGVGTITATKLVTAQGFFELLKRNSARRIDAATDVDSLA